MKRAIFAGGIIASAASLLTVSAAGAAGVKVQPSTFVGTAADCGAGSVAGTKAGVSAAWVPGAGLPDAGGSSHGLVLTKTDPLNGCSAAGASVDGVAGMAATQLGFDHKLGTACTGGAPRFNVQATDGFHFVGGCGNATGTAIAGHPGWEHIVFNLQDPAQAFPVVAAGAKFVSVSLIQDEPGSTTIDNINIDGQIFVGKPGNA